MTPIEIAKKQVRQKHLFDLIKATQQEYSRCQKQIDELLQQQKDITFKCHKMAKEAEEISHELCDLEYEALTKHDI